MKVCTIWWRCRWPDQFAKYWNSVCRPLYFFIFSLYSLLFSHAPPLYGLTPSPGLVFSHCQVDRESLSPFIVAWRPIADSGSWYLANAWRTATSVCASLLVESVRVSITVSVVVSPVYTSPLFLSPRTSSTLPSMFRFPPSPISLFWFWFWPLPFVGLARSAFQFFYLAAGESTAGVSCLVRQAFSVIGSMFGSGNRKVLKYSAIDTSLSMDVEDTVTCFCRLVFSLSACVPLDRLGSTRSLRTQRSFT